MTNQDNRCLESIILNEDNRVEQFRTEEAVFDGDDEINVFGSVAVRAVKSASVIAEWTGQDLGVGVSVAPFPNIPLVITPALRDITGAGDGTRFVVGTGFSFKF